MISINQRYVAQALAAAADAWFAAVLLRRQLNLPMPPALLLVQR